MLSSTTILHVDDIGPVASKPGEYRIEISLCTFFERMSQRSHRTNQTTLRILRIFLAGDSARIEDLVVHRVLRMIEGVRYRLSQQWMLGKQSILLDETGFYESNSRVIHFLNSLSK
jgi:hypothetical protein